MIAMQRRKGQSGERDAAALIRDLLGYDVRRRVRQHDGDSDLEGVPNWQIEIKRHKTALPCDLRAWWAQAVDQCRDDALPALLYRLDRREWRVIWPLSVSLGVQTADMWRDYDWAVEGSPQAWAAIVREVQGGR